MLYQYTCRFNFAIQVDFLSDKGMVFRQMSLMIFMTDEVVSVCVLPNIVFPLRYSIRPAAHHGTVQFTRRRREGGAREAGSAWDEEKLWNVPEHSNGQL